MSTKANMERASGVLAPAGWSPRPGVVGREFSADDLETLIGAGAHDRFFAWERRPMPPAYYEKLLEFRLAHYQQYGFGVHGVWVDGIFAGQFGLQVLDRERDQIEVVAFLRASQTGQGLGRVLGKYLINRAREAKLPEIYGVVRDGNAAGSAYMLALGGQAVSKRHHFGFDATVYKVDLCTDSRDGGD